MPDRCPFEISWGAFTPGLMEVYREHTGSGLEPCEFFDFDTRSVNLAATRKQTDFRRFYQETIPDNVVFDEWGGGVVFQRDDSRSIEPIRSTMNDCR